MKHLEKKLTPEMIPALTKGGKPSPWPEFVKLFGPAPMIWLAKWISTELDDGGRVWIPGYRTLLRTVSKSVNQSVLRETPSTKAVP